jgi:hypothetical protein
MYHTCNQYDGYTRAEGDTTQQSNFMILYDPYWGQDAWTQGGAEEEVIGGMTGKFTWERVRCDTIKKGTTDNAVAYATNKTMPAAIMNNLELI